MSAAFSGGCHQAIRQISRARGPNTVGFRVQLETCSLGSKGVLAQLSWLASNSAELT